MALRLDAYLLPVAAQRELEVSGGAVNDFAVDLEPGDGLLPRVHHAALHLRAGPEDENQIRLPRARLRSMLEVRGEVVLHHHQLVLSRRLGEDLEAPVAAGAVEIVFVHRHLAILFGDPHHPRALDRHALLIDHRAGNRESGADDDADALSASERHRHRPRTVASLRLSLELVGPWLETPHGERALRITLGPAPEPRGTSLDRDFTLYARTRFIDGDALDRQPRV